MYKAVLKDGSIVAVKRLDALSTQGDLEFIREVELLSRLHHRHLVNLVGFCAEKGERMLVYEYMGMGSLYEHLHGKVGGNNDAREREKERRRGRNGDGCNVRVVGLEIDKYVRGLLPSHGWTTTVYLK